MESDATPPTPPQDEHPSAEPVEAERQPVVSLPPKKRRPVKLILACLVLLLIAGGVTLAINHYSSTPAETTKPAAKKDVQLIRYGLTTGPIDSFYPEIEDSIVAYEVNRLSFEGLVGYQKLTNIVPELAVSWTNPDSTTWIFNLRHGVKFHNGHTMTAVDVQKSIEAAQQNKGLSNYYSTIKTVEPSGDYKIKITTDGPDPILLNKLTALYVFDSKGSSTADPANGTGPYQVKPGTKPSETAIDLVAFDQYHGGHVSTRELQLKWTDDQAAAVKDLNQGKLDFLGDMDQQYVGQATGAIPYYSKPVGLAMIQVNTLKAGSPVQKLAVRQALQAAIDVPAFIKALHLHTEPAGQLIPKDVPGYNPDIKAPAHDPAKAKALLASAGYPNGLTLTLSSSAAPEEGINEIIRQLKVAGITVKSQDVPDFDQFINLLEGGSYELAYDGYDSSLIDGTDFLSLVTAPYSNIPKLTELTDEAGQTVDPSKRLALTQQAEKIVSDQVLVVPLQLHKNTYLMRQSYHFSQQSFVGSGIDFWKVYR
jgi:peptide/nickel transport system substrate-binding protein